MTIPTFTQLIGIHNSFKGINASFNNAPTFVDMDGDGNQDLVMGKSRSNRNCFRNDSGFHVDKIGAGFVSFRDMVVRYASTPTFADYSNRSRIHLKIYVHIT